MATTKITLNELRILIKQIIKEEVQSTKEIKIGDIVTYSTNVQGLTPVKVKVTKIVNDGYFIGEIFEVDKETASYKGWEKGKFFQFAVDFIIQ